MMRQFKHELLHYWTAMNASAIQSAAHAGKAWLAVAATHTATGDAVPALNANQFLSVLGFAFILEIMNWISAHPLPALPVETSKEQGQ